MADANYWKARCRRAEGLLAKARKGLRLSRQREAVLSALGELKPGEWMGSERLARIAGVKRCHLASMEAVGLVVSRPVPGGNKSEWQLEHLVLVPEGGEA
ncbi:MAG: hypothetical protein M9929_03965 [Burkholderiaceae bacterium]|nr:hypothetical protein [Burkholderiaceae bacterium]